MGRHAGWIAASAELANNSNNAYVHKILLPEVSFDESKFLSGVEEDVKNYGYSVVVASEGLKIRVEKSIQHQGKRFLWS